jgi:integrase
MATGKAIRGGHKRGNNEGNIYQRESGLWEARVSLPGGRRKSVYGHTRREVQEKLTALLRDVQQGLPVPTGRETIGHFLERWLEDAAKPAVAPATHDSYRRMIARHLLPTLGNVRLDKLTPQHVQKLQAGLLASGLSPRTVAYTRALLRRALGQAVRWSMLPRNPVTLVDPPKQQRHEPSFLTAEEAKRLMASLAGDRLEPLVLLTLVTGLRRGEVLSLRWQDLDLEDGLVRVRGQYQKWEGRWQWLPLKTQQSRRTLIVPLFVVQALRQHRTRQVEVRLAVGSDWQDFDLVFCTEVGTPIDGPNLTRQFQRRLRRADVPHIAFHGLRHSAATLLLARGLTIGQIQKILGHASGKLTSDLYAHHSREIAEQAARKMEALFAARP